MKYKVLCFTEDAGDVIIANRKKILCVSETSLSNEVGDQLEDIHEDMVLTDRNIKHCDIRWQFSKKEWKTIVDLFKKIKL